MVPLLSEPAFSDVFRYWLWRTGLKKSRIALELGIDPSSVTPWGSGEGHPTVPTLYRLVAVLGTTLESFFGEYKAAVDGGWTPGAEAE